MSNNRLFAFCVVLLVTIHVAILVHGIQIHFPNVDEIAHLPSGVWHWKTGDFSYYRVNPPLVRLVAGFPSFVNGVEYDWVTPESKPWIRWEFEVGKQALREEKLRLQFVSTKLGGIDAAPGEPGNRFRDTFFAHAPVPLPADILYGVDYLRLESEQKMWSFLNGKWKFGGWPHYYFLAVLYKTPLSTLVCFALGVVVLVASFKKLQYESACFLLLLSVISVTAFLAVSSQTGFNHHHRYIIMIYPLIFVIASLALSHIGKPRIVRIFAGVLVMSSIGASITSSPHFLSYFNVLAGGPSSGWKKLAFSNVDWGQDLLLVDNWISRYPDLRPLSFELRFSQMNGDLFGLPRSVPRRKAREYKLFVAPGEDCEYYIVNVRALYNLPGQPGLQYLQSLEPIDRIGNSFNVYEVPKSF